MAKLIVHIGPHKTGTTMIQKFLMDNRAELFKQNIVYPKRHQVIFGHHAFRNLVGEKRLSKGDIEFFDDNHDFIISSEDFISLDKTHWEYLQENFESKDIIIVFAWRRASLKLYSIWQETIKHGGTESFFSYYHDHIARPGQSQMLSADLKLNMLSHVFGKQSIKIIDYDACSRNQDLLNQFCHAAGIQWRELFSLPLGNTDATNASMDIADIEIIRALNNLMNKDVNSESGIIRHLFNEHKQTLEELGLNKLKDIIRAHQRTLTVGNYFIDNRCEQIMRERYTQQMVNYEPHSQLKQINVAMDTWTMMPEANAILSQIVTFLMSTDIGQKE